MVQVQKYICGRPQDICNMRRCDIDMSGEIWRYTPFTHKMAKRGKIRELPIGPRAQKILMPYLEQCKENPEQFVFLSRKGQQCNVNNYSLTVVYACKKAGVPKWTPNQLRHAGGTKVRDKYGVEYAQAILGHAQAQTTEIYAKVSFDKAVEVAREIG